MLFKYCITCNLSFAICGCVYAWLFGGNGRILKTLRIKRIFLNTSLVAALNHSVTHYTISAGMVDGAVPSSEVRLPSTIRPHWLEPTICFSEEDGLSRTSSDGVGENCPNMLTVAVKIQSDKIESNTKVCVFKFVLLFISVYIRVLRFYITRFIDEETVTYEPLFNFVKIGFSWVNCEFYLSAQCSNSSTTLLITRYTYCPTDLLCFNLVELIKPGKTNMKSYKLFQSVYWQCCLLHSLCLPVWSSSLVIELASTVAFISMAKRWPVWLHNGDKQVGKVI